QAADVAAVLKAAHNRPQAVCSSWPWMDRPFPLRRLLLLPQEMRPASINNNEATGFALPLQEKLLSPPGGEFFFAYGTRPMPIDRFTAFYFPRPPDPALESRPRAPSRVPACASISTNKAFGVFG